MLSTSLTVLHPLFSLPIVPLFLLSYQSVSPSPRCLVSVGARRKAVKAAIVLLPLLGITNVLNMIVAPLGRSAAEFGLWSYATHFLTSFQGFFIALLYCFLNGEVSE